jgi:hypothetical protein
VSLSDKRDVDYVPPPYIAFSGTVNVLSSSASSSSSAIFTPSSLALTPAFSTDEGEMVNIQVRTFDHKRLRVRMPASATVAQLAAHIVREGQFQDAALRFVLNAGFPPHDLTDETATVSAAGLSGASVTMKKL